MGPDRLGPYPRWLDRFGLDRLWAGLTSGQIQIAFKIGKRETTYDFQVSQVKWQLTIKI